MLLHDDLNLRNKRIIFIYKEALLAGGLDMIISRYSSNKARRHL
jgi:hypothetical protein